MTFKNTNRRDDNEPELVEFWESCGGLWNPWRPGMGADGLLVDRWGWPYIVEVKNPKTGLALTKCEREYRDQVEKRGGKYHVIATLQQAADMIGVALDASGWLPDMKGRANEK
jgi:hypothetical protein